MSIVKGVNATKIATGGLSNQLAHGTYDARLKCITDSYEAAALATGSWILIGNTVPTGARIQEVILAYDALATCVIAVGDSASYARYIAFTSANAAGLTRLATCDGLDYVVGTASGDNQILVHNSGVSAATGTIKVAVFYTQD